MSKKLQNLNTSIDFIENNKLMQIFNSIVKDKNNIDEVIKAIVNINAFLLSLDSLSSLEDFKIEFPAIIEFVDWFNKKYEDNEEFIETMQEEFERWVPKFYSIYNFIKREQEKEEVEKLYKNLTITEQKNATKLFEYIYNKSNLKQLIYISHFDKKETTELGMFEITNENNIVFKDKYFKYIIDLIKYDGDMFFRYIKNGKIVTNGFMFQNGHIIKMDAPSLEMFIKNSPELKNIYDTEDFKGKEQIFECPKFKFI